MTDHYVYILTGQDCGPIVIETTSDLKARVKEHKCGHLTQAVFRIDRFVYVERYDTASMAEDRMRALRSASREWINALIERRNPNWIDLAEQAKTARKHAA